VEVVRSITNREETFRVVCGSFRDVFVFGDLAFPLFLVTGLILGVIQFDFPIFALIWCSMYRLWSEMQE
jgi:hypothetical protein